MNLARWAIGFATLGLFCLIGLGFALPGTWEVEREIVMELPPEQIWVHVADLRGWDSWAPMIGVESTFSEPSFGQGATRSWDSEDWGAGVVRVVAWQENSEFSYQVEVEDGAIRTEGQVRLVPQSSGPTRVIWREAGDFGWNPFLAFIALSMERTQGAVLEQGLAALSDLAMNGPAEAPATPAEVAAPVEGDSLQGSAP